MSTSGILGLSQFPLELILSNLNRDELNNFFNSYSEIKQQYFDNMDFWRNIFVLSFGNRFWLDLLPEDLKIFTNWREYFFRILDPEITQAMLDFNRDGKYSDVKFYRLIKEIGLEDAARHTSIEDMESTGKFDAVKWVLENFYTEEFSLTVSSSLFFLESNEKEFEAIQYMINQHYDISIQVLENSFIISKQFIDLIAVNPWLNFDLQDVANELQSSQSGTNLFEILEYLRDQYNVVPRNIEMVQPNVNMFAGINLVQDQPNDDDLYDE